MQIAVIEFARHVAGLTGAHSAEFDEYSPYPVVALMEDQIHITAKGGTMRLGKYPCGFWPEPLGLCRSGRNYAGR